MQLTYNTEPAIGRAGMLAELDTAKRTISRLSVGTAISGLGAFRVPGYGSPGSSIADPGQAYQNPSPAVAADADAIIATIASAASEQTLAAADADGVVGSAVMYPARRVTLAVNSSTDWDPTTGILTYVDQDGVTQTENLAIATSASLTTVGYVRQFVSLYIPAQTGAGGTATLGVAVLDSAITAADFLGVVAYDAAQEPFDTTSSAAAEYGDRDTLPIHARGPVWVNTEDACTEGNPVYVRVADGQLGAFRSDADGSDAVLIPNAKWGRTSSIGGLNILVLA